MIGRHSNQTGTARASIKAFEMTNAYCASRGDALRRQFMTGEITDEEDYARRAEQIEYDGVGLHQQMVQEGSDRRGWPQSMDRFGCLLHPA